MSLVESQTSSHLSSSFHRPSKKASSEISKTYKHAAQLYLTRRLAECYDALQPVIKPPSEPRNGHISQTESESEGTPRAPVATATTSQRIKIWSLYATLLNTIVELQDDEGKRDFGNKLYREIVRNVQTGQIWEQVVKDGYMGREGSVDAEVVYNLSNLLLAQAPNQETNQTRLETYLSSSPTSLDLSSAFNGDNSYTNGRGTDTPKDLNSRVKILELFTLHVLPRNDEWDYARSFVQNSDILDEERREAFLQTLTELKEAREAEEAELAQDLVGFGEETEEDEQYQDARHKIHMNEDEAEQGDDEHFHDASAGTNGNGNGNGTHLSPNDAPAHDRRNGHKRSSSEVDYGIEDDFHDKAISQPQPTTTATTAPAQSTSSQTPPSSTTTAQQRTLSPPPPTPTASTPRSQHLSPPPLTSRKHHSQPSSRSSNKKPLSKPTRPSKPPSTSSAFTSFTNLLSLLRNLSTSMANSLSRNPTALFRTLMFMVAIVVVLARPEVRERIRRIVKRGWDKVAQTVGMGVRVSYI